MLVGQQGPEFDEIRSKVGSLGSGVTLEMMETRILDALAEALTHPRSDRVRRRRRWSGRDGLALFFHDPLFREHLLRPGSFVKLRAKHALQGRDPDEPDVPLEFTVDELPLDIVNCRRHRKKRPPKTQQDSSSGWRATTSCRSKRSRCSTNCWTWP